MTVPLRDGPGRLLPLWDFMQRIKADELVAFAGRLENIETRGYLQKEGLNAEDCKRLHNELSELLKIGTRIGTLNIPSTLDQLIRIFDLINGEGATVAYPHSWAMLRSLHERFMDDVGRCHVFAVDEREADLLNDQQPFGAPVFDAFPSATFDIEEAAKCLALDRSTGAVFHMMRVVEIGLKATANALGIPYAPSWESYLRQIKPKLEEDWDRKAPEWRAEEPFFRDAYTHLHAVKLSWRNPTMHVVKTYTPEMADDIWSAVKGFMRHLSTKLTDRTPMRPTPLVTDPVPGA
jgi:hypothetical protein